MSDRGAPKFAGLAVLCAVVWIVAYWAWPSGKVPDASIDRSDADSAIVDRTADPSDRRTVDPDDGIQIDTDGDIAQIPSDPLDDDNNATDPTIPDEPDWIDNVDEPVYRWHTVAPKGETLQEISKHYYGTYNHWRAIARMNGHSVDPNRILPGKRIKVPRDPENVQGLPMDDEEGGGDDAEQEPESQYTEYIVSRNDSLWTIAKALYGSGTKWTVIRDANRDLVGSEGEKLKPGMVLKIPPPGE